ncbi:class A beta-lactamase [Actinomadura gamaensis]|uniref:Beta-lactamase n=1 Tax=Actinomadura gamaensis TaxID=1763541 RepID=A0ABV9UB82_9ACTN
MAQGGVSRRALLTAAALFPLAGCGDRHRPLTTRPGPPRPSAPPDTAEFAALEKKYKARLGLFALSTANGATVAYRADERFAFCSTFKPLAAAAVLDRHPLSHLDDRVRINAADVNSISPITKGRIGGTMTVRELCDAAIRVSDGTAGNLLVRDIGGPAQLNAYLRRLGDGVTRMDNLEPELNRDRPGDPRDTTTPRAIAGNFQKLVLGNALPADKHDLLKDWLERARTGGTRIRAALPPGWKIAHKTGSGDYGRCNDVAVLWPENKPPIVLAVLSDREGYNTPMAEPLLAEAAKLALTHLT